MARRAKGSGFSMRSGKKTSFKNMGSTSLNRTGYGNKPDGRSKSSPFQQDGEGWVERWNPETQTMEVVKEGDTTTTTTTTRQKGTATRTTPPSRDVEKVDPDFGKPGSAICKEAERAGMPCAEYIKKKEEDLGYRGKTETKPLERTDVDVKTEKDTPEPDPDPKPPSCYCINANTSKKVSQPCPQRITDQFTKRGKLSKHQYSQGNTSITATRKTGETHGPNEVNITRKDEVAPECLPGSKTGKSGCPGPDGKPMTRAQEAAKRKECKNRGTVASRLITKYRWDSNTCVCKKIEGDIPEITKEVGRGVKEAFMCLPSGFRTDSKGRPTTIPCEGPDGGRGAKTAMGNLRKRR